MRISLFFFFLITNFTLLYSQPDGSYLAERFVFLDANNNPINFSKTDTAFYSLKIYQIEYRIKGECNTFTDIGCEKIKQIKEKYKNPLQRVYEDNLFLDLFETKLVFNWFRFGSPGNKNSIIEYHKSIDANPRFNRIDMLHFNFYIGEKEMTFRLKSEDFVLSKHLLFIRFHEGIFEAIKKDNELQFFEITDPEVLKTFVIEEKYL